MVTQPTPKRHDLSLAIAAEKYGLSVITLRRRIADGSLPAVRVGPRLIRVAAEDVAALAHPIPTVGAS